MAEDDVERLVAETLGTSYSEGDHYFCCRQCGDSASGKPEWVAQLVKAHTCPQRTLARIVRELLAFLPTGPCLMTNRPALFECACLACQANALRERLNRLARGEEA